MKYDHALQQSLIKDLSFIKSPGGGGFMGGHFQNICLLGGQRKKSGKV